MFTDLFRFRDRQTTTPLEDFSTEALRAVLNSLPEKATILFLKWLVEKASGDWPVNIDMQNLEWRSQVSLGGIDFERGFVDLALYQNDNPVFVFENKIGAGFQENQLERYGHWVQKQRHELRLPPCLFVITHHTGTPQGFEEETDRYGVKHRAVLRWSEVLNQLRLLSVTTGSETFGFLVDSFGDFLEGQGMAHEYPTNEDLAALHGFVSHYDRIENLIDAMWDQARPHFIAQMPKVTAYSFMNSENGTWWKYAYCQGRAGSKFDHISVGIRFPDISIDWGSKVNEPNVFLLLDDDNDELPIDLYSSPGEDWEISKTALMAVRSLSTFSRDPDQRGEDIVSWIGDRSKELSLAIANRKTK